MKKELGNFDIVLVESILPAGLIAREIFKKDNVPYIVHAHSEMIMTNEIYKEYVDLVMKDAKSYMGVNKRIVDIVKERRKDCYLVPNFIDCSKFDIPRKTSKNKFILTSISNFYKVKKVDVLLKALDIVIKQGYKNVHLNIIGTGEYDEKDTFYLYAIRFNNYETDGKYGTTYGVIGTTLLPMYSLAPKSSLLKYVRTHLFKQNDENSATAVFGSDGSRVMTMARYRPGDFYTPENYYGPYPEPDTQTT